MYRNVIKTAALNYFYLAVLVMLSIRSGTAQMNYNTTLAGQWREGDCVAVEVDENYIYMGSGAVVKIYDNSSEYNFISKITTPSVVQDIIKNGYYLYVADYYSGLRIIDISDINNPLEIGSIVLPGLTLKLQYYNGYVIAANAGGGVRIIDVINPAAPLEAASYDLEYAKDLVIKDNYLIVCDGTYPTNVVILDISNPLNPIYISGLTIVIGISALDVSGDNLFASREFYYPAIYSINIQDIYHPLIREMIVVPGKDIYINGNYAYSVGNTEINIIDISNSDSMKVISTISNFSNKRTVRLKNGLLYTAEDLGIVVTDVSDPFNPVFKYKILTQGATQYLFSEGNLVYLSSYGIVILDISDNANPKVLGTFNTFWGTDKIFKNDNYVYLVDGNISGLRIIDVSFPNFPIEVIQIRPTISLITSVGVYDGYLYLAQGDSLSIWDISGGYFAAYVKTISLGGYCWEFVIKDNLLITAQNPGGILILDLTDPENPIIVSSTESQPIVTEITNQDNLIFGGTSEGFTIYDITNPFSPALVTNYTSALHTYDLKVNDNYLYVNQLDGGVKIYDISDINQPIEVGSFYTPEINWEINALGDKILVSGGGSGFYIVKNDAVTLNEDSDNIIADFKLSQNYPNPFNPITKISYQLPAASHISIKVFDLLGKEIATLVNEEKSAGIYSIDFNGSELSSGIYFYQMVTDSYTAIKKMALLK